MKWKNRFTNYNFWISIVSAVLLIFQAFNIEFDLDCISEIVTAVLGLLVVIGIISDPTKVSVSEEKVVKPSAQEPVKEAVKEKVEEVNVQEEATIPSAEKDEDCSNICQDDFKVVVDKISKDLEENIKILENINKDVAPEHSMEEAELLVEEISANEPAQVEEMSEQLIDGQITIPEIAIAPVEEPEHVEEVENAPVEEVPTEQPNEEIPTCCKIVG